ncbi:DNA-binding response regulator, NarL/FixJ family, contains REC and HTH domains [Spirosomataceae bacterium TFI 002]|nr:DNA-binding response regulator, NarL/FixJ family, contains REC and HTH domains [Spirosomataceae bacterium TFI 002]
MIKIAIAEDKAVIAETLQEKIELNVDFRVKIMATNGKDLLNQLADALFVDVVFMDINMPIMDGILATEYITTNHPHIKVIMCTVFDDEENIFKAIQAGASGYILKDESPARIHRYIYETIDGGAPMNPLIARKALKMIRTEPIAKSKKVDYGLSEREIELLEQLSKGITYEQIGDNLFISYSTVRTHFQNIYKKMQVHNKMEAVNKAKNENLI